MKNKIIPIILIFIMCLSSSVFAYTPSEYTYSELIELYGEPTLKYPNEFTENKEILVLWDCQYNRYYIYYTTSGWNASWNNPNGNSFYQIAGKGGFYECHELDMSQTNSTWKFKNYSTSSTAISFYVKNNSEYVESWTNNEIIYSTTDIIITNDRNNPDNVGTIFFPAGAEEIVQKHNKKTYYSQSTGQYISGDILLYDDFIRINNFETNYSGNLYISVLKYPITKSSDYTIDEANYQYEIISIIDKNSSGQEWQFSNPFDYNVLNEEECVYAIGIGPVDVPFILTSEWFNINLNQREYMNSENFRARYYIEDLTNIFLSKDDTSGNESGDNTETPILPPDEEIEKENGILPYLQTSYLNGLIPKNTTKPSYISSNYNGEHYYKVDFNVLLETQAVYNTSRLKIILGIYKANIDKENKKVTYTQIDTTYADAMAVYENLKENFGFTTYNYDLFNIWNRDGKIDTYINEYGIDNIAFTLHLFDEKLGYIDSYKDYLAFNKTWEFENETGGKDTITGNDKVDSNDDFTLNTDSDFWSLLQEAKEFLNKFLSFFDIFPGWLISLISTAILVAIICRIIGR